MNKPGNTIARRLGSIDDYPAVFVPNIFGGFDVFFPNFPRLKTTGVNFELARQAATDELNQAIYLLIKDGLDLPQASVPENLFQDDDEIPGTTVRPIEPDKGLILKKLGLEKVKTRMSPAGTLYKP